MKPDFKKGKKSKAKSSVEAYRSQIKRCFPPKQRQSERIDNKKDVQNHLQDIQNDLAKLSEKFDTLSKCLIGAFDKIESLETKVESQEVELKNMKTKMTSIDEKISKLNNSHSLSEDILNNSQSYARRADANCPPENQRLDRLEFLNSEAERKGKLMEVTVTHPNINNAENDLKSHVSLFFASHLELENRAIDANMKVKKSNRPNTVHVTLSHVRYKKFLFAAKKKQRVENPENYENMFVNDCLTSYNFTMLKKLKAHKKRCHNNNVPCFESLYTFEGKIYVKKKRSAETADAICISTKTTMEKLLAEYGITAETADEIAS